MWPALGCCATPIWQNSTSLGRSVPSGGEFYVGIMSGTSLDGIDAVLVDIGEGRSQMLSSFYSAYDDELKRELLALHTPSPDELHHAQIVANHLARLYAGAVKELLQKADTPCSKVRAIGCHGQTIRHRPEAGYSLQLGNSALLAELTGITVVGDFRNRDIAAGGQGAPLVPAFHDKLLRHPGVHRVVVNIGGISNLTDLAPGKPTLGFDCGPGNLLMDAWCSKHLGKAYDKDGAWASSGKVLTTALNGMLAEPYFRQMPPKSCGRDLFNLAWLQSKLTGNEEPVDVQATLLELTCQAISQSIAQHCARTQEIYLCGGGARNKALYQRLKQILSGCDVRLTDAAGIDADWMEAIAFAWLAREAMHGHSANLPAVTGARHPCILGAIYKA